MTIIALTIGGATKRSTLGQHAVEFDWDAMPDTSKDFIVRYGLRQYIADAMAGAENEADAKAKIEARATKLRSGDLARTKGEAKDAPDSVASRAIKLATATIRAALKAANAKADKEVIKAGAAELVRTQPKWTEDAQAQLDAEKTMGGGLDLAALGLIPAKA